MPRPAAARSLKCPLGVRPDQGQSLYAYLGTSIWRSPSSLQFLSISVYGGYTTLNSLSSFRFSCYLLSAPEYLKFWLSPQVTSYGPSELPPFQTACWGQLSALTHQTENTHTYIPKSRTIDVFCSWTYSTPIILLQQTYDTTSNFIIIEPAPTLKCWGQEDLVLSLTSM